MISSTSALTVFIKTAHAPPDKPVIFDLTNSSHTIDLFPKSQWRRCTLECLELLDNEKKLSSGLEKQGELYLRRNLLAYLERIRGVRCEESQIIITCGIQQSLEYICRLLPEGRGAVLMEEPGFNKAAAVLCNNGLKVEPVPVDEHGLVISELEGRETVCAVYTTPSHQFPTGAVLPIGGR